MREREIRKVKGDNNSVGIEVSMIIKTNLSKPKICVKSVPNTIIIKTLIA